MLVANLDYDDYVGGSRSAASSAARCELGDDVAICEADGDVRRRASRSSTSFEGLKRVDDRDGGAPARSSRSPASKSITIGDTIADRRTPEAAAAIASRSRRSR